MPPAQKPRRHRQGTNNLQAIFKQADNLIGHGHAQEAIALLEPLLASYPRVADLHYYVGYAHVKAGDIWSGLAGYERAMELSGDPGYWLSLASLYLELELNAHALHAFRQVLKRQADVPMIDKVREMVASLEKDISQGDVPGGLGDRSALRVSTLQPGHVSPGRE